MYNTPAVALYLISYCVSAITVNIVTNAIMEDIIKNVITPCNVVDLFFISICFYVYYDTYREYLI